MNSSPEKDWKLVWDTLVIGVREHVRRNGFSDVVLGLSGGMDSSLVAAIGVDALGKGHVHGVLMPSPWSSEGSVRDALALATNLNIETHTIPIAPLMKAYDEALAPVFSGTEPNVAEENLQSRIRGALLMALSNKFGWMLLATGNKSELAVGYCTLYGDLNGGLAPIADLYKTEVYKVAAWYNTQAGRDVIPSPVFEKAPSAELRPGQKDEDSLPPYTRLDRILHALVEEGLTPKDVDLPDIPAEQIREVADMMRRAAFKRRQAPPLLDVSGRAFGIHVE